MQKLLKDRKDQVLAQEIKNFRFNVHVKALNIKSNFILDYSIVIRIYSS